MPRRPADRGVLDDHGPTRQLGLGYDVEMVATSTRIASSTRASASAGARSCLGLLRLARVRGGYVECVYANAMPFRQL